MKMFRLSWRGEGEEQNDREGEQQRQGKKKNRGSGLLPEQGCPEGGGECEEGLDDGVG